MMKLYRKVWLVGLSLVWATLVIQAMLVTPRVRAAGPWYVGPGGSDSDTCLSPATRCASINGALGKAGFVAGDTIYVAVGTYTGSGDEVVLLDNDVTLSGGWDASFAAQSEMSTIDGQKLRRGITVNSGVTAIVEYFTVQNGSSDQGGGIAILYNEGSLNLNNSIIRDNIATYGGGIDSRYSTLIINNSIVSDNIVTGLASIGGGIYSPGGTTILNHSTVGGNTGGGIVNDFGGSLIVNSSTVVSNTPTAVGAGSGICNGGTLTLNNSTVSGNIATSGGGIYTTSGPVAINNSTISNNTANEGGGLYKTGWEDDDVILQNTVLAGNIGPSGNSDCAGYTIGSAGYNIIGNTSHCNFTSSTGDLINIDPKLGPLEGLPGYHPLLLGSPAINAGNPAGCMGSSGLLTTDQRGMPRVGRCDIGAYEYDGVIIQIFLPLIFRNYCPDFFDDFGNPASGWEVVEDSFVRSEYLNGEYRILSKRSGYFFFFRAPTCKRQNYIVETDARWVGTPGSSYGLIFGVVDSAGTFFNQYYLFDINTDFRQFRLLRRNAGGGFTTIVPITSAPAINGGIASNRLKVTRNGNQITLEVNGTVLGTWFDGTITGLTDVAIMSNPYSNNPTSDARFDNFSVTSLPGSSATTLGLNGAANAGDNLPTPGSDRIPVSADLDWQPLGNDVESESK